MWVHRGVLYINPGFMAEAVAYGKGITPQPGVTLRVLRPINGSESQTQLVVEAQFEDVDAYFANHGRPQPAGEGMKRWLELNQSRGQWELYRVVHDVPCEETLGVWVDRRTRYCPRARRAEALELWRAVPRLSIAGYSLRVLLPRTASEREEPLVVEMTAASLTESETFDAAKFWPEFPDWVKKVLACEESFPKRDILRVVE